MGRSAVLGKALPNGCFGVVVFTYFLHSSSGNYRLSPYKVLFQMLGVAVSADRAPARTSGCLGLLLPIPRGWCEGIHGKG